MEQMFQVMTFNFRVAVTTDPYLWDVRKHWAAKLIEQYKPDLIGTQEANPAMLAWMKERLVGLYDTYGVNRVQSEESGEFSAVFVRKDKFTIGKKGSFMLSESPEEIGSKGWDAVCERICSWVELLPKGDNQPVLRFYNTHLDHIGRLARKEGLGLIMDKVREEDREVNLPVIVTGDFNDTPGNGLLDVTQSFKSMTSCYEIFTEEEKKHTRTFHNYRGGAEGEPIDYIICSDELEFLSTTIVRDQVEHGYPSDHYPVVSEIRMRA